MPHWNPLLLHDIRRLPSMTSAMHVMLASTDPERHGPLPSIVQRYIAAYSAKDVETLLECLTEDVVFENLSGASTTTRVKGEAALRRAHPRLWPSLRARA